jgi:hypothetical protein
MSYIGAEPSQQITTPAIDYFSGNGVTTTFTLSRAVTSVFSVEVIVNGVQQNPRTAYTINQAGNIVFDGAPAAGTNNIYVMYNSQVGQFVTPSPGTVTATSLAPNAITTFALQDGLITTPKIANGAITREKLDSIASTGLGAMIPPQGTTAQRPAGTNAGAVRFNTSLQALEFQNSSGSWIGIGVQDGSSFANAGTSAAAIKSLTGTTTNGFYWILVDGTPTQVWCDMNNDGGGWMLAMQTADNNSFWTYDDAIWTNTTLINEGQPWDFSGHVKTRIYTNRSFTQIRMIAGRSLTNGLIENWSYSNMISLMGTGQASGNSRTAWINWFTAGVGADPLLQPNCNQIGVNRAFNYMYVKIGITANNEGDCATNDSAFGWGVRGISPYGNVNSFGAFSSSGRNNNYYGAIFVR